MNIGKKWNIDEVIYLNERRERSYKTDAMILAQRKFGEADKLITILTRKYGKKTIIAKGILRNTSPLVYHLDSLNFSNLLISRGKNLDIVVQANVINSFESIRTSYGKLSQAMYLLELVDKFTVENSDNHNVFDSVVATLNRINDNEDLLINVRLFELSLLKSTGFLPEFINCLECLKPTDSLNSRINFNKGGVLCISCSGNDSENIIISPTSIKIIRAMLFEKYEMIKKIKINKEIHQDVESILNKFILTNLNAPMKSQKMLDSFD
ncbi:MAG: DNA repair protein RecO [Dehalococcoidia bacterium]|nr:DNA repair protein RecO [Dehalococcoidia bacterium]